MAIASSVEVPFFDDNFFKAMKNPESKKGKKAFAKYLKKYKGIYKKDAQANKEAQKKQDEFHKEIESWLAKDKEKHAYIRRFFEMML
jgi:hypothetical protein